MGQWLEDGIEEAVGLVKGLVEEDEWSLHLHEMKELEEWSAGWKKCYLRIWVEWWGSGSVGERSAE